MPRPEVVEVKRDESTRQPLWAKLRMSDKGKAYNGFFMANGTVVKRVWWPGDEWMPKGVYDAMLKRAYGIFKKVLQESRI